MNKLKWWQILIIAVIIVIIALVIYNSFNTPKAPAIVPKTPVQTPTQLRVIVNRNTQDNNPNGLSSYEDPNALTDSNGVKAAFINGKYIVNGLEAIKCCNARSASTCKCTGWTWQAPGNCTDPGCGQSY